MDRLLPSIDWSDLQHEHHEWWFLALKRAMDSHDRAHEMIPAAELERSE